MWSFCCICSLVTRSSRSELLELLDSMVLVNGINAYASVMISTITHRPWINVALLIRRYGSRLLKWIFLLLPVFISIRLNHFNCISFFICWQSPTLICLKNWNKPK